MDAILKGMFGKEWTGEKLDNPIYFMQQELKRRGSTEKTFKEFSLPWEWDCPDTGLGEVSNTLLFVDEVLQGRPDENDQGLSSHAQAGLGSLCRLLAHCVSHYRTETFNTLDELQRKVREQETAENNNVEQ